MSDFKSKLPDLKELGSMTSKLFRDIKNSVSEIITDYKQKHPPEPPTENETIVTETKVEVKETVAKAKAQPKPAKEEKPAEEVKPGDTIEVTPGAPTDDEIGKEK
jgi:hypothetical protein